MDKLLLCYGSLIACLFVCLVAIILLLFQHRFKGFIDWINKHSSALFVIAVICTVLVNVFGIFAYFGIHKYVQDFDNLIRWADTMLSEGLQGFMGDYPAGTLLLITSIRWLLKLIGLADHYIVTCVVMKLPFIIANILLGWLIYRWTKARMAKSNALLISILILFNPAFLLNASMYGQLDGLLALFIVLSFYQLSKKKFIPAALLYSIACLIKAQAIFFAPVFGMFFILPLFKENKNHLKPMILSLVSGCLLFFIVTLPFKDQFFDIWLIDFFKRVSSIYPANTMGALNLFGLFGGNGISDLEPFLFVNYRFWGYLFIVLICLACLVLCVKCQNKRKHFLLAAFCISAVYTLGLSMHERYILPVIPLLLAAYMIDRDWRSIIATILYTIMATISQAMALFDLFGGATFRFKIVSGISVAVFIFLVWVVIRSVFIKQTTNSNNEQIAQLKK